VSVRGCGYVKHAMILISTLLHRKTVIIMFSESKLNASNSYDFESFMFFDTVWSENKYSN